jgi:hypothetical protein
LCFSSVDGAAEPSVHECKRLPSAERNRDCGNDEATCNNGIELSQRWSLLSPVIGEDSKLRALKEPILN